jgi:hypothetical protein
MTNEQKMGTKNMILKIKVGSYLYGTNTPESDEDLEEDIRQAVEKTELPTNKRFDEINELCMTMFHEFYVNGHYYENCNYKGMI